MSDFATLGLSDALVSQLRQRGIATPLPIQSEAMPRIAAGKNLAACSPPGTGKTLAFLLPSLGRIDPALKQPQLIVVEPTHELVMQVVREVRALLPAFPGITVVPLFGQVSLQRQAEALRDLKPQVLVGSLGRLTEMAEAGRLKLHEAKILVLDEADRLLGDPKTGGTALEGFLKKLPRQRQTLLFSASLTQTLRPQVEAIAPNAEWLSIAEKPTLSTSIRHYFLGINSKRDKIKELRSYLAAAVPERSIIFVDQGYDNEMLGERLVHHGFKAATLHSDMPKQERAETLRQFRAGRLKILVATDLAARGLDFPELSHVIHYDLPHSPLAYLHRAGRTGRAGRDGVSIAIIIRPELKVLERCAKELHFPLRQGFLECGKFFSEDDLAPADE